METEYVCTYVLICFHKSFCESVPTLYALTMSRGLLATGLFQVLRVFQSRDAQFYPIVCSNSFLVIIPMPLLKVV